MNSSSPKSRQRIGGRSGSQDGVLGRNVLTILHGHRLGDRPPGDPIPAMAVLGRSNVGKSSLLNSLLKTDVARVSQTPGRTQALYWYRVDGAFDVVDCPGYGYAKTAKEKRESFSAMIEAFLIGEPIPALALLLVDGRLEPQESDRSMALFLQENGIRTVVAATKWDAVQPSKRIRQRRLLAAEYESPERPLQPVSSETGEHLNDLARLLRARLISNPPENRPKENRPKENRTEES